MPLLISSTVSSSFTCTVWHRQRARKNRSSCSCRCEAHVLITPKHCRDRLFQVHTTHKLISERFSFSDALADHTLINVNTAVLLLLREEQCSSLFWESEDIFWNSKHVGEKDIFINQVQIFAVIPDVIKMNHTGFDASAHLPVIQTLYQLRRLTLLYPPGEESIMSILEAALRIWPLQMACGM